MLDGAYLDSMGYGILVTAEGCTISNCTLSNLSGIGIGITTGTVTIEDCQLTNIGRQAIAFTGYGQDYKNSRVIRTTLSNPGLDGIQICGKNISVEDCTISNVPFAGIYCATGTRNAYVARNTVSNCYGGIDTSWGLAGGHGTGDGTSSGIVISGNTIDSCVGGIGTGSDGTVICANKVTNTGLGASQTYTLMGGAPQVSQGGSGYIQGDVLSFAGGTGTPTLVSVASVDPNGAVLSVLVSYVGVYTVVPANPISVTGGTGTGAVITVPTWNTRGFWREGIGIVDAKNCVVTGNVSTGGQVGFVFSQVFTPPSGCTLTGNTLSGNSLYAYKGRYAGRYMDNVGSSHVIGGNA